MNKMLDVIDVAKQVISDEIIGLEELRESIDENFIKVIKKIQTNKGRLIFSGIGKSGYVARKISSTLSSTGIPSLFIHPAEAAHGDLGMITKQDIVILLSNSGDTLELNVIIDYCKRFNIFIIGFTRKHNSVLSNISDLPIVIPDIKEASEIDVPSTSVIMMISYWDAISIVLHKINKFCKEEFKVLHPGGKIGAKLLKVSKLLHKKDQIPTVSIDEIGTNIILEITKKRFGCTGVVDQDENLIGIITDGDLRRHINMNLKEVTAKEMMNANPITISKDDFAAQALYTMNKHKIMQLFIVKDKKPIGIIHMHDLLKAGVI
ncbi:MAG: arabinose-5-phosphate isomerase [Candidatus Midichloriaceae bacterium]|jgi:arabinose-5-phosphate isomerase